MIGHSRWPVAEPAAARAWCDDEFLWVQLLDGRRIGVPLRHFPRLLSGTPQQRAHYELIGDGEGISWPELDEDISIAGILAGGRDNTKWGRDHGSWD